jgi:hypothetical protein
MAGSQTFAPRGGRFAAALAIALATCSGRAPAQTALPPLPSSGVPDARVAEIDDSVTAPAPGATPTPTTAPGYTYFPGSTCTPTSPRVEAGLFATAAESIFGTPDPDSWRPLPLSTLFSEGWNEAWVPSPNGSGGAPRQGWINAADGNFYRLWFFTFAQGFNRPPDGNAYLGAFTIYTPLSRRLLLITNIPFELRNNATTGLPFINPNRPGGTPTSRSHSGFGDIVVHSARPAARDEGLLAHVRGCGHRPDRHPAPCGENRAHPEHLLLEQFRGRLGDPGRFR